MSGSDTTVQKLKAFLMAKKGKRGIDIPAEQYDQLHEMAAGETLPVWGRYPTPEQMQHLHDNKLQSDQIKDFYGNMNHPHVPGIKVNEYQDWAKAYTVYRQHGRRSSGQS